MAEVAVSIANAVKYVAISVSVVALVGLAYSVMNQVYPFVPYFAAAHLGGVSYLVFKNINPITGAGFAAATIAFTFPMFQALVEPRETKGTPIDPYEFANALKGSAEVIVGGIAGGLTYAIGGQNLFLGVVGAGLGAFLGGRYFWNPLVNLFAGLKLIDGLQQCYPASRRAAALAWLAKKKEQCAQPGWPPYCSAYAEWMSQCPYGAPNTEPLPPSPQGPPASSECEKYGTFQVPGEPYEFNDYVSASQIVQIYPHMFNCNLNADPDVAFVPVSQGDWLWFIEHQWSPVSEVTAGIFICTEEYSLPTFTADYLTPNNPAVPLNVTGSMKPGIYAIQGGQCTGSPLWNIQGPLISRGDTLNYERFRIESIGQPANPVQAAWQNRGKDFCAPANLPGPGGVVTPVLSNIQPLEGDRRGEFQIPARADLAYSVAAKRDAIAPVQVSSTAGGVSYAWASAPGVFDQPSPAGLPFPK